MVANASGEAPTQSATTLEDRMPGVVPPIEPKPIMYQERIVTVQGKGIVKVKPDIAHINIGVETKHEKVSTAQIEKRIR